MICASPGVGSRKSCGATSRPDMQTEPSRNQPCPCGSGRRYKDCHGRPDAETSREVLSSPERVGQLMKEALAHQKARRPSDAERSYRAVLEMEPGNPDALHMLGVICLERGERDRAKAYVLQALDATDWKIWTYRHNLALILADEYPPQVWTLVSTARAVSRPCLGTTPSRRQRPTGHCGHRLSRSGAIRGAGAAVGIRAELSQRRDHRHRRRIGGRFACGDRALPRRVSVSRPLCRSGAPWRRGDAQRGRGDGQRRIHQPAQRG